MALRTSKQISYTCTCMQAIYIHTYNILLYTTHIFLTNLKPSHFIQLLYNTIFNNTCIYKLYIYCTYHTIHTICTSIYIYAYDITAHSSYGLKLNSRNCRQVLARNRTYACEYVGDGKYIYVYMYVCLSGLSKF